MKIYTGAGDDGSTGVLGGGRVRKDEPRMAAVGEVDELNAALGLAAAAAEVDLAMKLRQVQNELFIIGSHLAAGSEPPGNVPSLPEESVKRLERQIDEAEQHLPALRQFILPGGSEVAARLHLARTVCRRAERAVVALAAAHPVVPIILSYLNRLSDWLFMQARLANHLAGVEDVPWMKQAATGDE